MSGFITLHRKILEWEWYGDPNTFRLFIHLLLKANHKAQKWKGIDVGRGQLITGRKVLAAELGLSERQIRTSLNHLKSTNEVTIKSTNKYSLVTIVNYGLYQDFGSELTTKKPISQSPKRPATDQQPTTNNNDNNGTMKTNKQRVDYTSILNEFHTICVSLPSLRSMTDKRKKAIQSFLKNHSLDELTELFERTEASDFLTGRAKDWCSSFDWILKPSNAQKILEGNYDNKGTGNKNLDVVLDWYNSSQEVEIE